MCAGMVHVEVVADMVEGPCRDGVIGAGAADGGV